MLNLKRWTDFINALVVFKHRVNFALEVLVIVPLVTALYIFFLPNPKGDSSESPSELPPVDPKDSGKKKRLKFIKRILAAVFLIVAIALLLYWRVKIGIWVELRMQGGSLQYLYEVFSEGTDDWRVVKDRIDSFIFDWSVDKGVQLEYDIILKKAEFKGQKDLLLKELLSMEISDMELKFSEEKRMLEEARRLSKYLPKLAKYEENIFFKKYGN